MVVTKWIMTLLECSYYLNDCYCSRMVAQQLVISNNYFVTVTSILQMKSLSVACNRKIVDEVRNVLQSCRKNVEKLEVH